MTDNLSSTSDMQAAASGQMAWNSDAIAETLRRLDIEYIALVPGSSFRGLHDSLVNFGGNKRPEIILCLHEEHAVAVAHGYYKASGRPMAVALHANVGLMHASMAIFNAWCDRVPILILGAAGPYDAAKRRPWVDWLHSAADIGALVRGYTKWDDQPLSCEATVEALLRGHSIAMSLPRGPTYVCMDVTMQEQPIEKNFVLPQTARFGPATAGDPRPEDVEAVARHIRQAERPVFLLGRVSAEDVDWGRRVALAEATGARVIADLRVGSRFPSDHPNLAAAPGLMIDAKAARCIGNADLIVSFDWVDLGGTLKLSFGDKTPSKIVHCSMDQHIHRGWSMDYQSLPPTDMHLLADPDRLIERLLEQMPERSALIASSLSAKLIESIDPVDDGSPIGMERFSAIATGGLRDHDPCYIRLPIGWPGERCEFKGPRDYLGYDGSGGIGSGPGMAVGGALALRDTGRLAVAVLGDGDFMMGATAIWTAVNKKAPLLVIVANNQSFFNDELHQERVARARLRDWRNRGVGVRVEGPVVNLAELGHAQGAISFGPITTEIALKAALTDAVAELKAGAVVVIDVHVASEYGRGIPQSVLQSSEEEAR
ncbi:thiamine pyrophosphate-binding protein [Rhizobium rhizogenes]|uniref:thiamine pyrophosphate-binding protein n=1 Tax=Rhizobium rhizogenes TaxID=359 RepID=UPI0015720FC2|nr:thiamine pyrophosphate-binding protein [Rhizobium rhizogenes]NTI78526.1 thiamine pyrophosphate-binding protein [Rhizobium rhizogenes]